MYTYLYINKHIYIYMYIDHIHKHNHCNEDRNGCAVKTSSRTYSRVMQHNLCAHTQMNKVTHAHILLHAHVRTNAHKNART